VVGKRATTRAIVPVVRLAVDLVDQRARVQARRSLTSGSDDGLDDVKRPSTGSPLLSHLVMESQQRLHGHAAAPRRIYRARDLASLDPTANRRVADCQQLARERSDTTSPSSRSS
jgi:hypothetical protein